MGSFGFQEFLVIAVIALLVFGPDRLPDLARQAGKAMARFRQETSRSVAELRRAAELDDLDRELRSMRTELREVGRELVGSPTAPTAPVTEQPAPRPGNQPAPTDPEAT